jgi:hypothetical protein
MYTLRIIETDGREVNIYLGTNYTIYRKESISKEDFDFKLNQYFGDDTNNEDLNRRELVKAFIDAFHLPNALIINHKVTYYIVNDSGKTFQKI